MTKGYYNIECDYDAFNDPSHWCRNLQSSLKTYCGSYKTDIERNQDKLCDPDLLTNATQRQSSQPTTVSFFSPSSIRSKLQKCGGDCSRQRNIDQTYCRESCQLCLNATCNGERPHVQLTPAPVVSSILARMRG